MEWAAVARRIETGCRRRKRPAKCLGIHRTTLRRKIGLI